MSFLRSLATDLRERQVLPAVLLLVVLAIGIPVYAAVELSKSSAPQAIIPPPVDASPPAGAPTPTTALAAVQTAPPVRSKVYKGNEPNPFGRPATGVPPAKKTSTTPTATTTPSTGTTSPSTGTTSPSTTTTTPTTKPAPAHLADNQAYQINAVSTYGSQKDTLDDMQRLTPAPANVTPEIVYLGVLKGGKRAVFLLTDAVPTTLGGSSGSVCEPSQSDCQVIELSAGEQLQLTPSSSGTGVSTFTFKVTSLRAETYSSDAAANGARESASTVGEAIVGQSGASVLANFFYALGIGAVIYEPAPPSSSTGPSGTTGTSGATSQAGASGVTGTTGTTSPSNASLAAPRSPMTSRRAAGEAGAVYRNSLG
jgi:hypothetical protein